MSKLDVVTIDGVPYDFKDKDAYVKPSGGIPASDMSDNVRTSLGKADNAAPQSSLDGLASRVEALESAGFITKMVNDLVNYYTKNDTYTKTEVNALVSAVKQFKYVVASSLPTASESTMYKMYLVPATTTETQNIKDEYITIQSGSTYSWEQIGSTAISISAITNEQIDSLFD